MKKIFAEPLVQFILLGTILFLLVFYIQKKKDREAREITVDDNRVGMMLLNYKTQTGALPSKQQLDAMIDDYINEEIQYREAKKMGLDKDDEIIRRRLSQKIAFMQTDLNGVNQPSDAELLQFYKENPSSFQTPGTVSFSHIYFSTDKSTDSLARQKALAVAQSLKNSTLQRAPEKGDRFPLQYDYTDQSQLDIQQNFGNKAILDTLFNCTVNTWAGPVQSGYGWHLVYVSKRAGAAVPAFETVKEDVQRKYADAAKEAQNKKAFNKLKEQYNINRAYLQSK